MADKAKQPSKFKPDPNKPIGRPKAPLNWNVIEGMLQAGCKAVEVASYYGIDVTTLYRRCEADNNMTFSMFYAQNKATGNARVKTALFNAALKGEEDSFFLSPLIFLAKSRLGMSDKPKEDKEQNLSINVVTVPKPDNEAS